MLMTITNNSRAEQGIWTETGLQIVQPGQTRTLDVAQNYVKRVKALTFLAVGDQAGLQGGKPIDEAGLPTLGEPEGPLVEGRSDPLDHDGDEEMGGSVAETSPAPFDEMDDDALRAFITERDGKAPHPNTGREKLLTLAKKD